MTLGQRRAMLSNAENEMMRNAGVELPPTELPGGHRYEEPGKALVRIG
jgi:hypothetical protein